MPIEILIILVFVAALIFLLAAIVAFVLWRRNAKKQAAKKAALAKKKQAAKPQGKPTPPAPAERTPQAAPKVVTPPTAPVSPAPVAAAPVSTPRPIPTSTPKPSPTPPPPPPAGSKPEPLPSEKIRILIVDDNPDTRENVSRLLYFEDDMEVIAQAVNGRQGIEMAAKFKPHIVLMDINMPDMDGITATEQMTVESPYSQVIIMSVQAEQHYMKRAMAAGARDFQPKPFTSDELINCVRRVYEIGRPIYQKLEVAAQYQAKLDSQPKVKLTVGDTATPVIVVYSPKGGIGTSAIAANLAVALQQLQGEVVLMDGDLQFGDISVNLNVRQTRVISDMIHEGQLDVELLAEVVLAHESGLKVLLAPPQPQLADAVTPDMLTEVIKGLKKLFKVVVVDTSSQLTDATMNILERADYILLVTGPELPAIKSAKLFLELAGQLEIAASRLGVVVNRANLPGGVGVGQIAKVLKMERAFAVPYDSRLYMAAYKGVAVSQQDPGAPSAQAIGQLAAELWQKLAPSQQPITPVSEVV
jgi:pilus assembly protein CpaE